MCLQDRDHFLQTHNYLSIYLYVRLSSVGLPFTLPQGPPVVIARPYNSGF